MKKIELLAPAGNLAKLKYALHYGADAVYCGLPDFSLRVRINQFSKEDIVEAVNYAHERKKKIYVTLNIYAHNCQLELVKEHLSFLAPLGIDGVIVSDPGIIRLVKKFLPNVELHLSTQANATNYEAVEYWKEQGIARVILAREVTLAEVKEIHEKVKGIELETFVHGAMCMSYSGRCILSKWMSGRSANLGDCSQPCRWKYQEVRRKKNEVSENENELRQVSQLEVIDDQNKFQMDVEEDKHGTYFFNSCDLNLLEHVSDIINAGVGSLKIEGRAKSAYYVSVVTRAYRKVIDAVNKNVSQNELALIIKQQQEELEKLIYRGYTTGFLLGEEPAHNFSGQLQGGGYQFVGEVVGRENDLAVVKVHNAVLPADILEAIVPEKNIPLRLEKIYNHNHQAVEEAHGGHGNIYYFKFDVDLAERSLLRKRLAR